MAAVSHDYAPQLATLVKAPPNGDEWIHEIKFDGYRIGAVIQKGHVTLYSRNGKDWTAAFPEVVKAIEKLKASDALIDGEVASVLPDGRTSFQALQNASGVRGTLAYFVFDLLRLGRANLERLPLEERKNRLRDLLGGPVKGRLRYSEHISGNGQAFFDRACASGLEGIISKRRDLPHRAGRHGGWVKTKCIMRQEFVIGGFTDPEGARSGIGALLIGYYDGERLVFAGKVGTGFTHQMTLDLRAKLDKIEIVDCAFTPRPAGVVGKRSHWVKPTLVCEVAFTEWTVDGKARHPSFQGLRKDKRARDVVRESASNG